MSVSVGEGQQQVFERSLFNEQNTKSADFLFWNHFCSSLLSQSEGPDVPVEDETQMLRNDSMKKKIEAFKKSKQGKIP